MGRLVEQSAFKQGHTIVAEINSDNFKEQLQGIQKANVGIDFSHPDHISESIQMLSDMENRSVIGTTGWMRSLKEKRSS